MADDELSSECLDRLEAVIVDLVAAQLHSIVILDSIVSKLNVILLKLHIPIPSSSSITSHHADEEVSSDAVEELVLLDTLELSSEVPPLPMAQGAAQVVWLSSRPVSAPEFSSMLPPLVTKHVAVQVVLSKVFRTVHQHYRHNHCNMVHHDSVILYSDAANWFCLRAINRHSLIPTPILIWDPSSIFLQPTP